MGDNLTAPALSPARIRALLRYLTSIRNQLLLNHWTISYLPEYPDSPDAQATMDPIVGRYITRLRLGEGFFETSPAKQRLILLHEVLHVHRFQSMYVLLEGAYKDQLGQVLYDALVGEYKRMMEYEVDLLAEALAPLFPLPPRWPK